MLLTRPPGDRYLPPSSKPRQTALLPAKERALVTPLKALASLVRALSARRKRQLAAVAALMLASAFCEVATIGAVLPFLTILAAPDQIVGQGWFSNFSNKLGSTVNVDLSLAIT